MIDYSITDDSGIIINLEHLSASARRTTSVVIKKALRILTPKEPQDLEEVLLRMEYELEKLYFDDKANMVRQMTQLG